MQVTLDASASAMETAAVILRTFCDRGPSGDREAIQRMADELQQVADTAKAEEDRFPPVDFVPR